MALDGNWKDDLDVTRVMQAPKVKNFVTQPDIPLESFNPIGINELFPSNLKVIY